jgi:transcriptional regulator with XRE-family HTH domain/HEAT repeat protein
MSQLAPLLREYFQRSSYKSIAALARAARAYSPLSESYLKQLLRGERARPAYDKLMAIAQALDLNREETNRLLEAAGFPPLAPEGDGARDPEVQRVLDALAQLRRTPDLPAELWQTVLDSCLLLVEGARVAVGATARPVEPEGMGAGILAPMHPSPFTPQLLGPGESLVDDLLGEILSRSGDHPLDTLFLFLEEAAREDGWEIKRRIAEALPQLVELQPEATLRLAELLREDFHPDYQADIRRRVVEAVPALCRYRSKEALQLLTYRERDGIYTAMAIVEALHDLESAGLITAVAADRYLAGLCLEDPVHEEVIAYLHRLLHEARETPATALLSMRGMWTHTEKLYKICIVRTAPRLLRTHPHQVLDLMTHFLRRDESGEPVEHKNVRRPVAKALPEITALLAEAPSELQEKARRLFQTLARDPDLHVRRALGDALLRLVAVSPELAMAVMDALIHDPDPYVRQRAGRALLKLADRYPEQAHGYYVALLGAVGQ